ncbi:MAG: glycosyltransferase family 4 protein [Planctomycetota bacterium]|jgi:glycosyltransferase involved in cell wall biosynthesis
MAETKKILLVHPFAQDISGPDRSILAVIKNLQGSNFHFDVVLPAYSPFTPQYEELGCRIFYYPMSIIKRNLNPLYLAGFACRFIPTIMFLKKVIKEINADLVHTNGAVIPGGGLAARWSGVKSIYHIRCTAIAHPAVVASPLCNLIGKTSDRVIAISSACAAPLVSRGYEDKVRVVFNGIELESFKNIADRDIWRSEFGIPQDSPIVGQVGRFGPDKGWLEFAKACRKIKDKLSNAHFISVGAPHRDSEKEYFNQVKEEVAKMGMADCFHFAGRRDNIAEVMAGFDVFVTQALEEGLGRVAIEAMAAGCPVVANNIHGLREVVIEGETGLLAGPNDPDETAEKVFLVLNDKNLSARFSENGKNRAFDQFSAEKCAENTAKVYQEII